MVTGCTADGFRCVGLGSCGLGQVLSAASSVVQNSVMCSYKYHCLSQDRPFSKISSGSCPIGILSTECRTIEISSFTLEEFF